MDFNDYYDILKIDDSAAESEIKVAIRKTRSRYRNLTGSPNKDQARKAEHMIDVLAEAEKVSTILLPEPTTTRNLLFIAQRKS